MSALFTDREIREFNLSRWFDHLAGEGTGNTLEGEMLAEHARTQGVDFIAQNHAIPWELLNKRTLTATGTDGGSQFVSEHVSAPQLAVRDSLIGRLGVPVVSIPAGSHRIPRFPQPVDGEWLADEFDGVASSQPSIGSALVQPKTLASLASWSRDWHRDAVSGRESVEQWLLQIVGRSLDKALLTGSGTEGQPLGLANRPGVQTGAVDATETFGDLCGIEEALEVSGATNSAWILSPSGKKLLRNRYRNAGTTPILEGDPSRPVLLRDHIDGTPAVSTTACPDGRLFAGDWGSATVYVWGAPSIAIKSGGQSLFSAGSLQMRILLECDIVFSRPERFAVASLT
jgi:HK97 family phage major capsid protein